MIKEAIQTDSNISSMRLVMLLDIIACVGIAVAALILDRDLTGTAMIIGALLLPVCGAKAYQSKNEN